MATENARHSEGTRPAHFCIARTDSIGDVILTLPLAEAVKRADPATTVTFLVREYTAPIVRLCPSVDHIWTIPERDITNDTSSMADEMQRREITHTIFAYPRPYLSIAAWKSRALVRAGTAYRWYSFLYNRRVREHRRDSQRHESEYNLNVLNAAGLATDGAYPPALTLNNGLQEAAASALRSSGIDPDGPFAILHPGSGGSAREWSAERFAELGKRIVSSFPALNILVTGGGTEAHTTALVADAIGKNAKVLPAGLTLDTFAAVIARAALFVSNSTGPLHIAGAFNRPCIGLYPFERAMNPRRWKPFGTYSQVLTPEPAATCRNCGNERCPEHDNMERITVDSVFESALKWISGV